MKRAEELSISWLLDANDTDALLADKFSHLHSKYSIITEHMPKHPCDRYDQFGWDVSPLADAIIDHIAHDSYRINITNIDAEHDISLHEVYSLDKALHE